VMENCKGIWVINECKSKRRKRKKKLAKVGLIAAVGG
jgi:hypothetical protein